jgi:hypothetical protein
MEAYRELMKRKVFTSCNCQCYCHGNYQPVEFNWKNTREHIPVWNEGEIIVATR